MTHQSDPYVRMPAAHRLRTCPCSSRMFLIDEGTFFCEGCGRVEKNGREAVPRFFEADHRRALKLIEVKSQVVSRAEGV